MSFFSNFGGAIGSGVSDLLSFLKDGFVIIDTYTNNIYKFDSYSFDSFQQLNRVPTQPLQFNTYATDSKIVTPSKVTVLAHKTISIKSLFLGSSLAPDFLNPNGQTIQSVEEFKQGLTSLANAPIIVDLTLNTKVYSKLYDDQYTSYTMESVRWERNPRQLFLSAEMVFVKINYTNSGQGAVYNSNNPSLANGFNNGNVSTLPSPPNSNPIFNQFGTNSSLGRFIMATKQIIPIKSIPSQTFNFSYNNKKL